MNLEIEIFKNIIKSFDFKSELGFSFFEEELFNKNSEDNFFRYQLINRSNKSISIIYYPCNRSTTSNEIEAYLVDPNGYSIGLSEYLAYEKLNKRLNHDDVLPYRFKVDCDNLQQSISVQLQRISDLMHGEFKKYLTTEATIHIPVQDPRDEY